MPRALALSICLACATFSSETRGDAAPPAVRATIDGTLSADGDRLVGTVSLELTNDTDEPLLAIPLSLYANRFRTGHPDLSDRMIRWIYPAGESPGGIDLRAATWNDAAIPPAEVAVDDGDQTVARVTLPAPLEPGQGGVLEVEFELEIPQRRGRFGRWRGVVSLGGGWFPRPLADLRGQGPLRPQELVEVDARIALPPRRGAVLSDRVFPWKEAARVIEVKGARSEQHVLVVMDLMEVTEERFPWGRVVHVHRELRKRPATWKDTRGGEGGLPEGVADIGEVDISGRLFEVCNGSYGLARALAPEAALPDRLLVVEIPAWDQLVQTGPGPVLVSDRLWRMVPFEKALWFHDLALARAVGTELTWPLLRETEDAATRPVTGDLVGSLIAARYSREVHGSSKTVAEMIGFASFVPTIDNLLYAPQVPFREVYSRSPEEPDPLRDEPWRASNQLPRGKRVLAKLEDLIGPDAAAAAVTGMLTAKESFEATLGRALEGDHQWFFDQWYREYPSVNYQLGEVRDEELGDGRVRHTVEVVREGEVIREPVTVLATDDDGATAELTWEGDGRRGLLSWVSRAPIDQVQIDPHGRLVEDPALTADHPLADNYLSLPWRPPMLTRVLISGDLMAGDPYITVGFSLRRRYDVTNAISAGAYYNPRGYGGSVGYYRSFGRKRTLNSRSWYFGPSIGVSRYLEVEEAGPEIPEETRFAATAGSIGLSLGRDNRSYFYDPLAGLGFSVHGGYSGGRDDEGRTVQVGRLSAGLVTLASPAMRHTFALSLGAMGLVGSPAAAQLATLSVRQILRAFDVSETYGRIGVYAVGEYRHTLFDAASINVPPVAWLDRFQGVLFAAGGTISEPTGYDGLFTTERLYSEVGYGLRLHTLAFGVQQYVVALDFAWALTPLDRRREIPQADGTSAYEERPPFKLVFGIMQTF